MGGQSHHEVQKTAQATPLLSSSAIPAGIMVTALIFIPDPQFWPFMKMFSGVLLQPFVCHFWCSSQRKR